jgi:predicted nuclease of predicted toxin-antitoxin system
MRFLLDVNASGSLADWLKELGHDVIEVRQRDSRMKDDDILNWASSEKRIIVTIDNDFEEIIWRQGKTHYGILRLENLPRAERKILLFDTLDKHSNDLDSGAIVIASKTKFRVRRP